MAQEELDRRLETFRKALTILKDTASIREMNIYERGGLIQYFEVCFEQVWKCLKAALVHRGFAAGSPREVIRQAAQAGVIDSSYGMADMLEDRNLTMHTYNEELALRLEYTIKQQYLGILTAVYESLERQFGGNRPA